jgi:hypothetical protein
MFEFAAGQLHQEERERRIAEGLRRRELLESAAGGQGDHGSPARQATIQGRAEAPVRATVAARAHAQR